MRKLIAICLVFMTTFLKGQSVDPETFPTLNTGIGNKYLYTNTGGEGKMLVDSVATRSRIYWRNGVNGQDSMGLGGTLVQPTVIDINTNPFLIDCGGYYNYLTGGYTGQGAGVFNLPDLSSIGAGITGHGVTALTKVVSPTEIQLESIYNNQTQVGRYNGFIINYNNVDLDRSFWTYNDQPNNQSVGITLDVNGFVVKPNMNASATNWLAPNVFKIQSLSGDIMTFKTNGLINIDIDAYDDDTDAGLGGLVSGDIYETSATNTLGLPAGVLMKKQ